MRISTSKNKIISVSLSITSIFIIFLFWIFLSNRYQNEYTFPNISKIFNSLVEIFNSKDDLKAIGMTIFRAIVAVCICLLMGIVMISIYIICPISISFFRPIIRMMRSVPLAVVSIFILILVKDRTQPYVITILMTFPVVFEGLITSINEINSGITDEMKLLKGSPFSKIKDIYLPIILPYIIMTIVQALGMSFKVLIMGEYLCYTDVSIGKNLYDLKSLGMSSILAYGIIIVLVVSILEYIVLIIKNRCISKRKTLN